MSCWVPGREDGVEYFDRLLIADLFGIELRQLGLGRRRAGRQLTGATWRILQLPLLTHSQQTAVICYIAAMRAVATITIVTFLNS